MGFRAQLDTVLRTPKGRRVLDEASRLARDPGAKRRIDELRDKLVGSGSLSRGERPADRR